MTNELQQAIEAKTAAAQALAEAEQKVREIALLNYEEARLVALDAGVNLPTTPSRQRRSEVVREKLRAAGRAQWANKTPEQRAAWMAAIRKGRVGGDGTEVAQ